MEWLGKKVRDYKKRTNVLEINLKKKFLTSITEVWYYPPSIFSTTSYPIHFPTVFNKETTYNTKTTSSRDGCKRKILKILVFHAWESF